RDISEAQYNALNNEYQDLYQQVCLQCEDQTKGFSHIGENMLRIYTLAIQKGELKELFRRDEINESIYKKNLLILDTQTEKVQQDRPKLKSLNTYLSSYKSISSLIDFLRRIFFIPSSKNESHELYLYYHTQYKLINKVLDELEVMENSPLVEIFDDAQAIQNVIQIYQSLKKNTVQQMENEIQSNRDLVDEMNEQSAKALLHITQADTLKELHEDEIISSKLHVLLKNEMLQK
ncbi:MAG: sodium:proton antiporter, partial [Deltaproteobacteria bacterium]|nr:sodium:proton antiporter [Deltaproteobacteria bacterium]